MRFVFRRLVGSFYVSYVSEETASKCEVEVGYRYSDYVCDTDRLIYGLCIVAFVPMEANKKNGFTVTWSKFPGIKNAFDPQEQLLQTGLD